MELCDVQVEPTTAGRIGRNLLGMQEYPLALRIHATRPRDAYLTEDEEVESAQASCMRYVEGLPNIAAKHVRYVQILTH